MGESSTKYKVLSTKYEAPTSAGRLASVRQAKYKSETNVECPTPIEECRSGTFFTKNPTYNSQACTKYRFKLRRDFRSKLDYVRFLRLKSC